MLVGTGHYLLLNREPEQGLCSKICEVIRKTEIKESLPRKIARLGVVVIGGAASFVSLYPSMLIARPESAWAVLAAFGPFGAWGYWKFAKAFFQFPQSNRHCLLVVHIVDGVASISLGIASRMPSAGVALKIAPGIPASQRLLWAFLGLVGTAGPEIFSTFEGVKKFISFLQYSCTSSQDIQALFCVKKNLENYLNRQMERIIEDDSSRGEDLAPVGFERRRPMHLTSLESNKKSSCQKIAHSVLGVFTSAITVSYLSQNTIFSEFAIDDLLDIAAPERWILSALAACTLSYAAFKLNKQTACNLYDRATSCCGTRYQKTFGEKFYPIPTALIKLSLCGVGYELYDMLKISSGTAISLDQWYGQLFAHANILALYLLIYNVIENLFIEPGIELFAEKYSADFQLKAIAHSYTQLKQLKNNITTADIEELAGVLQKAQLTSDEWNILVDGSQMTSQELTNCLRRLTGSS